jgi:hypothetical protein
MRAKHQFQQLAAEAAAKKEEEKKTWLRLLDANFNYEQKQIYLIYEEEEEEQDRRGHFQDRFGPAREWLPKKEVQDYDVYTYCELLYRLF